MKAAAAFILLSLLCVTSAAQTFDVAAWDVSGIPGYDEAAGKMYTFKADPKTSDTAFVVHVAMKGYIWVLDEIYVHERSGTCYVGNRTVQDGRSRMLYRKIPCHQFDAMYRIWKSQVNKFIEDNTTKPLNGRS